MDARGYAHVDHTADLAIHAWGETLGAAFAEAARGLFAYMTEMDTVRPVGELRLALSEETPERLLHAWLEDLLFHHQRDLLVFAAFRCEVSADGKTLEGVAEGEAYDAERHGPIHEVKAVTYHDMRITRQPPRVEVVVDI